MTPDRDSNARLVTVEIRASIDTVFDFLVDPQRMRSWAHDVDEVRFLSGAPEKVGSRFRQSIREGQRVVEYEGEVLACERPEHVRVRLTTAHRTMEIDYLLTPNREHTILALRSSVTEHGLVARLVGSVIHGATLRPGEVHLSRVKRAVEDSRDVS